MNPRTPKRPVRGNWEAMYPDRALVRSWFPSLASDFAFMENAGGSQVPGVVPEAISHYMQSSYVQVGAGYPQSVVATETVSQAHDLLETMMNAQPAGRVAIGPSTTVLLRMIAMAYGRVLQPGDEIVVADSNHESNAGPWHELAALGVVVKAWPVDPVTHSCSLDTLRELITERTKLVTMPHVSNLIGRVEPVSEVIELAHAVGAKVVVDGVAFAPHRLIDVQALGADWYVFSTYKVFGPHMAALYGRHESWAEIPGPNHFFIDPGEVPYKFELGGVSHEGCAGLLALRPYFRFLADREADDRATVERAFGHIEALEKPLTEILLEHLASRADLTVYGEQEGSARSVPTISFRHRSRSSADVSAHIQSHGIGVRHGHMYAYRLCTGLGFDPIDGVVRVSMAHYNTEEEVERLIDALPKP